jgi:hypothetical protein
MKKYKINFLSLVSAIFLFVFALVYAEIIPGGSTAQYVIVFLSSLLILINLSIKVFKKR